MEMIKKEQVVCELSSTSPGIKPEPVVMHLQSHKHESLQCFKCLITFPDTKSKQTHMRMDHWLEYTQHLQPGERRSTSPGIKPEPVVMPLQSYKQESLQCFHCLITFPDIKSKDKHMSLHHWLEYRQQLQKGERRSTSPGIKPEPVVMPLQSYKHESLQCFHCLITFPDIRSKQRHTKLYHGLEYTQHQQPANIVFTCSKCSRSFSSSDELRQHQFIHIGQERPYSCTFCPQAFFTFSELFNHKRLECPGRQCRCKDCGTVFSSPSLLSTHRRRCQAKADGITTYRCCKCRCGFLTKEKLSQHQEYFSSDPRCGAKKRGRKPKYTTENKKSKRGEGDGCKNSDSTTEGCPQTGHNIPCSKADCDLIFPSVAALRAHKREKHSPPPNKK